MYYNNNRYTRYTYKKKYLDMKYDLKDFDPERTDYSDADLQAYTDLLLWENKLAQEESGQPEILFEEHVENRWNREVLNPNGVPDDEITHNTSKDGQTMYWRFHPEGRKLNSAKQRAKNGASIYR